MLSRVNPSRNSRPPEVISSDAYSKLGDMVPKWKGDILNFEDLLRSPSSFGRRRTFRSVRSFRRRLAHLICEYYGIDHETIRGYKTVPSKTRWDRCECGCDTGETNVDDSDVTVTIPEGFRPRYMSIRRRLANVPILANKGRRLLTIRGIPITDRKITYLDVIASVYNMVFMKYGICPDVRRIIMSYLDECA